MNYPKSVVKITFIYEWENGDDIDLITDSILTGVKNIESVMNPVDYNPFYIVSVDIEPDSYPIEAIDNHIRETIADSRKRKKKK